MKNPLSTTRFEDRKENSGESEESGAEKGGLSWQKKEGLANGRLNGHPIHVILVHLPVGLFTAAFLFDLGALLIGWRELATASFWSVALGSVGAVVAAIFGLVEYTHLAEQDRLRRKAGIHATLELSALTLFVALLFLKLPYLPDLPPPGLAWILLEGAAFLLMATGNFFGADLIFSDGMGREI